jgi:hypothetical protein
MSNQECIMISYVSAQFGLFDVDRPMRWGRFEHDGVIHWRVAVRRFIANKGRLTEVDGYCCVLNLDFSDSQTGDKLNAIMGFCYLNEMPCHVEDVDGDRVSVMHYPRPLSEITWPN